MGYIQENQILLYEELCAKPVKQGDKLTEATIRFRNNIRLANHIAIKFSGSWDGVIDKDDIIQCAYEGLWKACLSFDESKGYEFSTYAVPNIRGQILRELRDSNALHTPRWFKDMRSALISHGFTLPLSNEEIDVLINEGKFSREQIMAYAEPEIISMDAPIKEDTDNTVGSLIPDKSLMIYEDYLSEDEIEEAVDKVLVYIKPMHRDLVEEWMYATLAGYKITQEDLGRKYGVSQPQCGRILRSAIDIVKMHGDEIRKIFGL